MRWGLVSGNFHINGVRRVPSRSSVVTVSSARGRGRSGFGSGLGSPPHLAVSPAGARSPGGNVVREFLRQAEAGAWPSCPELGEAGGSRRDSVLHSETSAFL